MTSVRVGANYKGSSDEVREVEGIQNGIVSFVTYNVVGTEVTWSFGTMPLEEFVDWAEREVPDPAHDYVL